MYFCLKNIFWVDGQDLFIFYLLCVINHKIHCTENKNKNKTERIIICY